jgi:RNA polymerase sigma-70 factor (ECF subfamily)
MMVGIVRIHAARLIGRYGFATADRDDINQELLWACLDGQRRYNPAKSSRRTFLSRVARNQVANLRDSQSAACRDYRLCTDSLNDPAPFVTSESITLSDTISTDARGVWVGRYTLSSWEREELRIDVAKAISSLPDKLAGIARLLMSVSAIEAGRQLAIPRATVYRRIAEIRGVFAAQGLHLYFTAQRNSPSKRRRNSREDVERSLTAWSASS